MNDKHEYLCSLDDTLGDNWIYSFHTDTGVRVLVSVFEWKFHNIIIRNIFLAFGDMLMPHTHDHAHVHFAFSDVTMFRVCWFFEFYIDRHTKHKFKQWKVKAWAMSIVSMVFAILFGLFDNIICIFIVLFFIFEFR